MTISIKNEKSLKSKIKNEMNLNEMRLNIMNVC